MTEHLLMPPDYRNIEGKPLVFLAGPIQGAPDWQTPTAENLLADNPGLFVASPRLIKKDEMFEKERQVNWELDHIDHAVTLGGVAFWFAAQDHSLPYKKNRAYSQTTRVEIGDVSRAQKMDPSVKVWVGFDPDYTKNGGGSEEYIEIYRRNRAPDSKIFHSLDDMIKAIKQDTADL